MEVSTSATDLPHMSRHSTPASDFGRLTLGSSGGSSNEGHMAHRKKTIVDEGTRRRSARLQANATSSTTRRVAEQQRVTPASASSRRPTHRSFTTQPEESEEENDDDEDEDDEDDDEDDDEEAGDDGVDHETEGRAMRRTQITFALSVYNPSQLSIFEFMDPQYDRTHRSDDSRRFRDVLDAIGAHVAESANYQAIGQTLAAFASHESWIAQSAENMETRVKLLLFDLPKHPDVLETLMKVRETYGHVYRYLVTPRYASTYSRQIHFLNVMVNILKHIVVSGDYDIEDRNSRRERPHYAAGGAPYQNNLYQRLAHNPDDWTHFVRPLQALAATNGGRLKRAMQPELVRVQNIIRERHGLHNHLQAMQAGRIAPGQSSVLDFLYALDVCTSL